jgi:hypothetical protein
MNIGNIYQKKLIWEQLTCCDQCGEDYWAITNLDTYYKPHGYCKACREKTLEKIESLMKGAGLAHAIQSIRKLIESSPR